MRRAIGAVCCLMICSGCLQQHASVTVSAKRAVQTESVMETVYPTTRSVFSEVYDSPNKPKDMTPALPGAPSSRQFKPPLREENNP
ncbi:hypothetical protein [Paenibacillus silvisoli]|uniref:hypothetical protein n=1 Tax=Paenibacillus silvisoli TaxID=3110539 RepID=UPI002805166A|nr:hypothetical protein [Paenibacillus silvisoli]